MGRRLILDTNVLIAYERGTIDRSSLDADELAIASVSVAEYRVGNELADSASRAADRARALAAIMSAVDVLDYTQATAAHHGRLLAHVRRGGTPRGAHDLIIAAHAAETGRTILSRDANARFGNLPGVSAIDALFQPPATDTTSPVPEIRTISPCRGYRPQLLVVEQDLDQRAAREPLVEVLAPADPRRDIGPVSPSPRWCWTPAIFSCCGPSATTCAR